MVRSITGELDEKKKEKVKRVVSLLRLSAALRATLTLCYNQQKKQKAKPTEVKPEPKKKLSLVSLERRD